MPIFFQIAGQQNGGAGGEEMPMTLPLSRAAVFEDASAKAASAQRRSRHACRLMWLPVWRTHSSFIWLSGALTIDVQVRPISWRGLPESGEISRGKYALPTTR